MNDLCLINLPFLSPQMPPLGIALIAAFLVEKDISVTALDLNIELYNYLLDKKRVEKSFDIYFMNKIEIDNNDLLLLLKKDYVLNNFQRALDTYLRKNKIYNYEELYKYTDILYSALTIVIQSIGLTKLDGTSIDFVLDYKDYSILLETSEWQPIIDFTYKKIDDNVLNSQFVGLSWCYESQTVFLLLISEYIKQKYPSKTLFVGGSMVSTLVKGGHPNIAPNFFHCYGHLFDFLIIEDGEYPIYDMIIGRENKNVLRPYLVNYFDDKVFNDLPSPSCLLPAFEILPIELYLAPKLVLPMITSRHCYWNKCSFCTHTLGYSKFAMYSAETIFKNMKILAIKYSTSYFYFCDECTPPSMALNISRLISAQKVKFRWLTEMRFEKELTRSDFVHTLFEGGCRYIAFGLESINDRVLQTMKKGVSSENIKIIIDNCFNAHIQVNLMFFFGFPSETIKEAKETFDFVMKNYKKISAIGMGVFVLTPQSQVAKNKTHYKISEIHSNGEYIVHEGMTQQEAAGFYEICKKNIAEDFYRGHLGYHRTYYIYDLSSTDYMLYPLGLTKRNDLHETHLMKRISKENIYKLSKDVVFIMIDEEAYFINVTIPGSSIYSINANKFEFMRKKKAFFAKDFNKEDLLEYLKGGLLSDAK